MLFNKLIFTLKSNFFDYSCIKRGVSKLSEQTAGYLFLRTKQKKVHENQIHKIKVFCISVCTTCFGNDNS